MKTADELRLDIYLKQQRRNRLDKILNKLVTHPRPTAKWLARLSKARHLHQKICEDIEKLNKELSDVKRGIQTTTQRDAGNGQG